MSKFLEFVHVLIRSKIVMAVMMPYLALTIQESCIYPPVASRAGVAKHLIVCCSPDRLVLEGSVSENVI